MSREITKEEIDRKDKEGWFPVACRLCGSITWFHKDFYKVSDFARGYECHKHCKTKTHKESANYFGGK